MKAKCTLIVGVLCLLVASCCGPKKVEQAPQENVRNGNPKGFETSAPTKRFVADVETELATSGTEIVQYTPSSTIVEEYGLREQNGSYMFSGMVKTGEAFRDEHVSDLGGSVGSSTGSMRTVNVPVRKLYDFLQLGSIEYFELATKAQNK